MELILAVQEKIKIGGKKPPNPQNFFP